LSSQFNLTAFRRQLGTQWLAHSMLFFEELESTNTYLKKLPADEIEQGLLCLTDHQTEGRGQYERKWESKRGKNLTFSLAFKPSSNERLHVLTLACALAIVEYLNDSVSDEPCACIKWPNDVMLNDRKVGGLLTETVFSGNVLDRLVIGIGLNVNQQKFPADVSKVATSISLETKKPVDREKLLSEILQRIEHKYQLWDRHKNDLIKVINRNIIGYGQWIGLIIDEELQEDPFKLLGINEHGELLMLNQDGGIESFSYEQIRLVTD